jgi:hypothetical protein
MSLTGDNRIGPLLDPRLLGHAGITIIPQQCGLFSEKTMNCFYGLRPRSTVTNIFSNINWIMSEDVVD